MEWYVNFGTLGVVFGSILFGILIALVDAFCPRASAGG